MAEEKGHNTPDLNGFSHNSHVLLLLIFLFSFVVLFYQVIVIFKTYIYMCILIRIREMDIVCSAAHILLAKVR